VVRLWLGTVAATAAGSGCVEEGIRATYRDDVLEILFRIVMQCQIIDDVLDYSRDASAGLPSFLTASASLPEAIERTYQASREYARQRDLPRSCDVLPLRTALAVTSIGARLMILLCRWRCACFKSATSPRPRLRSPAASR
jgi:signal transduction histidine kinase